MTIARIFENMFDCPLFLMRTSFNVSFYTLFSAFIKISSSVLTLPMSRLDVRCMTSHVEYLVDGVYQNRLKYYVLLWCHMRYTQI